MHPKMKRSKTPSSYYKPTNIYYSSKGILEPNSYYGNMPAPEEIILRDAKRRHESTQEGPSKLLESNMIVTKQNSTNGMNKDFSKLLKSKISQFSSMSQVHTIFDKITQKQKKKYICILIL